MEAINTSIQEKLISSLKRGFMDRRDKYIAANPPAINCQNRVNGEKKAKLISVFESIKQAIKLTKPIASRPAYFHLLNFEKQKIKTNGITA